MTQFDTTGRRLPLPRARFAPPETWKDADQKQLLQFLKTPKKRDAFKAEVNRLAKLIEA